MPFQNQGLQTNKSVINFSFEQIHFSHQTNTHHLQGCAAKVHGETTAQTPSTVVRNLTNKPS